MTRLLVRGDRLAAALLSNTPSMMTGFRPRYLTLSWLFVLGFIAAALVDGVLA